MIEELVATLEGPRHAFPTWQAEALVLSAQEAVAEHRDRTESRVLACARSRARKREVPLGGPADLALIHVIRALKEGR